MTGNIPIPELKFGEEAWLALTVTLVREKRTFKGEPFHLANGRNGSGGVSLNIPNRAAGGVKPIKPGLWRVSGRMEAFQNQQQFTVSEFRAITLKEYRELQNAEPILPRAYTIDIETIALAEFRERAALKLKQGAQLGKLSQEQQERYIENQAKEEQLAYRQGSLAAISGRILSIAVHSALAAEFDASLSPDSEHVFGIDVEGREQPEKQTLFEFLTLLSNFDPEMDEIVGHNIINFDLPFIFQRCLVNDIPGSPFINLGEYNPRGVYDTMSRWWLGSRNRVSLDDLAWALRLESSKTDEVDGSRIFDLYHAGRLSDIREYNLKDVRLTRKIYERMVGVWGR